MKAVWRQGDHRSKAHLIESGRRALCGTRLDDGPLFDVFAWSRRCQRCAAIEAKRGAE